MTQRTAIMSLIIVELISIVAGLAITLFLVPNTVIIISLIIMIPIFGVFLYGASKEWSWIGLANSIFLTLTIALLLVNPTDSIPYSFGVYIPLAFNMILVNSSWMLGLSITQLIIVLIREQNPAGSTISFITVYLIVTASMYIGRLMFEYSQRENTQVLELANTARLEAETTAKSLASQTEALEQQSTEQRQLLETVYALETPIVEVAEGVLMAPIVGHFHSERAERLSRALLQKVAESQSHTLILDITGITMLDTALTQHLMHLAQAVRLLGGKVVMSGINPNVATTLVEQNVSIRGISTAPTLQVALDAVHTHNHAH